MALTEITPRDINQQISIFFIESALCVLRKVFQKIIRWFCKTNLSFFILFMNAPNRCIGIEVVTEIR